MRRRSKSKRHRNPAEETYVLLRDGKEVHRGTAHSAILYIHKHHSYSYAHALKYEGYKRKKLSDMANPARIAKSRSKPRIGQRVMVHGKACRIFKVHPAGTIDVEEIHGPGAWRLSGLAFRNPRCNPLGRVAARGFVRVRRSVTPQFIARRAGVPVSRILSIIGR